MKILGIETSCDETAVSIVENNNILANIVASQHDIHSKFGGIVPELASRRHVEVIYSLLKEACSEAKIKLNQIDGIAVTKAPGLVGAVLVGLSTAKAISYALKKPLIGVNHLEGHINAIFLSKKDVPYPHIGLIVSGGHTSLYMVKGFGTYKLLGATRDDAAGEAFDKVARLLDLGYPGGPIIDKLAKKGDSKAFKFTHPKFRNDSGFDFSFSGIKTAVMLEYKKLKAKGTIEPNIINDLIASFQQTVADILTEKVIKAAKHFNSPNIVISGGVAANSGLRENLKTAAQTNNMQLHIPPMELCTDNAAMIAYVGTRHLEMGEKDDLKLNAIAVEEIGM